MFISSWICLCVRVCRLAAYAREGSGRRREVNDEQKESRLPPVRGKVDMLSFAFLNLYESVRGDSDLHLREMRTICDLYQSRSTDINVIRRQEATTEEDEGKKISRVE